jgi:hypothetical protein
MYNNHNNAEIYRLSAQQQVSLDRHQQMINNALKWREVSYEAEARTQPKVVTQLRTVFASILTLFVR